MGIALLHPSYGADLNGRRVGRRYQSGKRSPDERSDIRGTGAEVFPDVAAFIRATCFFLTCVFGRGGLAVRVVQ
jgi:hypothetical protein